MLPGSIVAQDDKLPLLEDHLVRMEVEVPEGVWASDLGRRYPEVVVEIISHMATSESRGQSVIRLSGKGYHEFLEGLRDHPSTEMVRAHSDPGTYIVRTICPKLQSCLQCAFALPETPFALEQGNVNWSFRAQKDEVLGLWRELEGAGIRHRLISMRDSVEDKPILTPRQQSILELALVEGFYEHPRRISITDMASILGISKASLAVTLKRIENRVVSHYWKQQPTA